MLTIINVFKIINNVTTIVRVLGGVVIVKAMRKAITGK